MCGSSARADVAIAEKPAAQQWGDLTGRLVCDCEKPLQPRLIEVARDQGICGKSMQSESLLVNPKDGGLANAFIYLRLDKDQTLPAIHPDYEKTAKDKVPLDISKCRFVPHAVAMRTSQKLCISNHDEVAHNANLSPFANLLIPDRGDTGNREHEFSKPETLPIQVYCGIHVGMQGWILVREDPYFAVTDESGRFEIKNLPVGEWTFQLWHERAGYIAEGKRGDKIESCPKGRLTMKIAPGRNDLSELHLSPKLFEDK